MPNLDLTEGYREAGARCAGSPARAATTATAIAVLRYLDVVLLAVATPVALALGAPVLGYAVGAGAWVLQRVLAEVDRRWVRKAAEPRTQLGLNLFEAFGRIWLLAGAIVLAGVVGGRADGLTAALVIFGAYSVAFAIRVVSGPPNPPASTASARGSALAGPHVPSQPPRRPVR
jgi:hypothetical protein